MAHEILGERFISRVTHAWHNIAKRIFPENEEITASQAMAEISSDINVIKTPAMFAIDGEVFEDEKESLIVRVGTKDDPTHRIFGMVKGSWTATSYVDLASALDQLSKRFKVETAGVLKQGSLTFLCFRGDDYAVKGKDEINTYFTANLSLLPGVGHKFLHSPVRVVCMNTNTLAEESASISLSIPHTSDAQARIELAARLVSELSDVREDTKEIFDSFADHFITSREVDQIIAAAYPEPSLPGKIKFVQDKFGTLDSSVLRKQLTPELLTALDIAQRNYERAIKKSAALKEVAHERYEKFEPTSLGGTAWAAYNAVTEVSDWREGRNSDYGALFGERAKEKERAFKECAVLVRG